MKKIQSVVAIAIVFMLAFACASKQATTSTSPIKEQVLSQMTMSTEQAEGKALFETNCAKCHKLYDPKNFSAEEWKPIVERMTNKARLAPEQGAKIYAYVSM